MALLLNFRWPLKHSLPIVLLAFLALGFRNAALADEVDDSRASFNSPHSLRYFPLTLNGGSKLTLVSPERWTTLAQEVSRVLDSMHTAFTKSFGPVPPFVTSLRLLDEESFFELTGAPRWTNAMFFRGQILIPLPQTGTADLDNLSRSARHEYTHALISAMSAGKAPGWLDEGLAQWAEGSENPALQPALRTWLTKNEPVPLGLLRGGFTKLRNEMVPAAYAQSLFATHAVLAMYGTDRIRLYMNGLRLGVTNDDAFLTAFGTTEHGFEQKLGKTLRTWSGSKEPQNLRAISDHKHNHSHAEGIAKW